MALAHSRWVIEQFYEDGKGEFGLRDFSKMRRSRQGRRWDGLQRLHRIFDRHPALVMLTYSFLMHNAHSPPVALGEVFSPSRTRPTFPAAHRRVLEVLVRDLMRWLIYTNQIELFRPRLN